MTSVTSKAKKTTVHAGGGEKPRAKPAAHVEYVLPVVPHMLAMSSLQLIEHSKLGATQAAEAGVELLRRKKNRAEKKAAELLAAA